MKRDKLDALFSEFIRKRAGGVCERCYGLYEWKRLQCSHFWGRAKKSVRFDPDNAAALCAGCHMYFTAHPKEHYDFFLKRLGQRDFDLLEVRASRPHKIDRSAMEVYLRVLLKDSE